MDVIKDIQNNFVKNRLYSEIPGSEKVIDDLEYDFGDSGINMSDARKSWAHLLIGKWFFDYEHLHRDGEISSSKLKIYEIDESVQLDIWDLDDKEQFENFRCEEIFTFNIFMLNRWHLNIINNFKQYSLLEKFCADYKLSLTDALTVLGILCAFPFGQAVTLFLYDDREHEGLALVTDLDEMLDNIYPPSDENSRESRTRHSSDESDSISVSSDSE